MIRGLIKLNPEERLSIPEILSHPWIKKQKGNSEEDCNEYLAREDCMNESEEESQPSANNLNIENVFFSGKPNVKLSFQDYCYIANDFYTHHLGIGTYADLLDEEAIKVVEAFGYPRALVIHSLNNGLLNHATAAYNLLTLN